MPSISRLAKHTGRFFSKNIFGSPNVNNLKELEKLLSAIKPNSYPGGWLYQTQPELFASGSFNFIWLTELEKGEFQDMNGEWIAHLQSFVSAETTHAASILNPATRALLFNTTNAEFWKGLQGIKYRYQAIASKNSAGYFSRLMSWMQTQKESVSDSVHHNEYFGYYLTQYDNVNVVYEDCQKTGAENETENTIVKLGGLWKTAKAGYKVTTGALRIAGGDLSQVKTVVVKGVELLNNLGGLIAGIVDIAKSHEGDFRRLSARCGLEDGIEVLREKYFGPGDQGTLLEQTIAGPQRLEKKAEITLKDLDTLRDQLKHSLWWCENWKLDIKEIEKDLGKDNLIHELSAKLEKLRNKGASITPTEISRAGTVDLSFKDDLRKKLAELKAQVTNFDYFLTKRVQKLNDLLAEYDTRRDIAKTQKTLAAAGVVYDAPRQLALEISKFDKSSLLAPKVPGTLETPSELQESGARTDLSVKELLASAMSKRRQYISPEYDDDYDD